MEIPLILKKKLVFGDNAQLQALKALEARMEDCERCDGEGTITCHECNGDGKKGTQ